MCQVLKLLELFALQAVNKTNSIKGVRWIIWQSTKEECYLKLSRYSLMNVKLMKERPQLNWITLLWLIVPWILHWDLMIVDKYHCHSGKDGPIKAIAELGKGCVNAKWKRTLIMLSVLCDNELRYKLSVFEASVSRLSWASFDTFFVCFFGIWILCSFALLVPPRSTTGSLLFFS